MLAILFLIVYNKAITKNYLINQVKKERGVIYALRLSIKMLFT